MTQAHPTVASRTTSNAPRAPAHEFHPVSRLVLFRPDLVARRLDQIAGSGKLERTPNVWQITLGVLRMWHRVLFRSETIGTSSDHAVRGTLRARLLELRGFRFPFLLWERAIAPWDFSGLLSSEERVMRHLLGAHHDGNQFAYDLEMLAFKPAVLEELRSRVRRVLEIDDARSRWLRDLTVYEGYHESLLAAVERALSGEFDLASGEVDNPDISFMAYLRWCAAQPATPEDTLAAYRAGRFTLSSDPRAVAC